jgi:hypothetical protein
MYMIYMTCLFMNGKKGERWESNEFEFGAFCIVIFNQGVPPAFRRFFFSIILPSLFFSLLHPF